MLTGTTSLSHPGNIVRVPAIAGAIASAVGAGAVGTFLIKVAVTIGVSLVTSWAISALSPKPRLSSGMTGTLVNSREAAAPQEYIYGTVRKGGTITYIEATGNNNKFLHMIIALAGHEVSSIGDIYIDDKVVTLDANGFVTSGDWNSKIRVKKYTGAQTTAPAELLAESAQIDSNFVGRGIAYLYVRLEYDQDVFPNGVPLFTAIVNGKKVTDPRSASTSFSQNAALCVRDYIISDYGLGDVGVDEIAFANAANISDENVTLDAGGTEKRYTLNGVIRADQTPGSVLQDMMTSCAGTLFWGQGNWQLKAGYYSSPVKAFDLDDFRSPIQMQTRQSMADTFNVVRGTFVDKAQNYVVADFPEIASAIYLAEDNGVETPLDLTLPYTTSAASAQRIAKLTLNRGREQITMSADFSVAALGVQIGDVISITNSRYGWSAKEFEVVGWRFFADQDAGDIRVNMTLRETSEEAYDWDADENIIIGNNTLLPIFTRISPPSNLLLVATTVLNNDGIAIPAIRASWTAPNDSFVQYYEAQYKRLGGEEDYGDITTAHTESENWGSITTAFTLEEDYGLTNEPIVGPDTEYVSALGTTTSFLIQPVLNGYDYQVRVRSVNSVGVRSAFITNSLSSIGDTTPPGTPLGLNASAGLNYIELRWTNPADQDFAHVEIWESATNNLSAATQIGQSTGSNFIRANLANNVTRFYWVRAVDFSLNKSPFTDSVTATTRLIAPNDFNQAVNDLFAEAGAFGIEPVSSLPATGAFDGQLVLLLPEIRIYRWDAATSSWSTELYTQSAVETGSITATSFASGIEPIGVVDDLPTVSGYTGPSVVFLTTDGKLYRLVDGAWTAAVNTEDIDGQIGANLFPPDLRPVEVVSSLPVIDLYQGRIVLLTTDNKMYRYTGSEWTAAVPAADLTGQITGTQIGENSITTSKIAANSIEASKIAAGAITAEKITAGAVSADKIAANAVLADKIAANAITAGKIAANAVTANAIEANSVIAGKIAAGAVNAAQIAAGAITTDKLFAAAVTADKIATGVINADKIAAGAIITSKIAAGAVTAQAIAANNVITNSAQITDGIITNAKIGDTIQSNDFVSGSTGWRILKTGSAEFNGVVVSRQLEVDSGDYFFGNQSDNNSNTLDLLRTFFIETNTPVSAWTGSKETYMALVGRKSGSNFGTVRALTANVNNQPSNIQWGWEAHVVPLTRWSGNQRLWIKVELYTRLVDDLENFTLTWRLIKVT
jgi:hypothetical protein